MEQERSFGVWGCNLKDVREEVVFHHLLCKLFVGRFGLKVTSGNGGVKLKGILGSNGEVARLLLGFCDKLAGCVVVFALCIVGKNEDITVQCGV